jgi:hypothetical protein
MTKTLFGGSSSKSGSTNTTGFGALTPDLQQRFLDIAEAGGELIQSPSQYFAPMGLTEEELLAGEMLTPEGFQSGVSQYLNPFRQIITEDINRAFEDPASMVRQRASEAGAFGGSRQRDAETDLERARLDAIAASQGDQFNQAANQFQQGLSNLFSFGGLKRGIDLAERQALPSALSAYSSLLNPLLSGGYSSSFGKSSQNRGITQGIADIFGGGGGAPTPTGG